MDAPFQSQQPKNIFSAQGRIGRMTYFAWLFLLGIASCTAVFLMFLVYGITIGFSQQTPPTTLPLFILIPTIIILCITVYLSIIFTIRRLHDRNHTGWLSLLLLVPFVGSLFQIYIYFAKGNQASNQFGTPRITQSWEKVVTWIGIIMTILSFIMMMIFFSSSYNSYIERSQLIQQQMQETEQSIQAE